MLDLALETVFQCPLEGKINRAPLISRREFPVMSILRNVLLVAASILLTALPVSAAVLFVAGGSDTKPPVQGFVYQRAPFDCTPLQVISLNIGVANSLQNDTTGGTSQISGYPCAPWSQQGPEHIYQLTVAEGDTLQFQAELTNLDPQVDHDIFLLNACDTDSCIVGENTEFSAALTGGTYYLIIDGAGGDEGPYTLEYSSGYVGVAPIACAIAIPVDLDPGEAVFEGTLYNQFNSVQTYECSSNILKGGELWYSLTLPAAKDNQWGGKDFSGFQVEFDSLYLLLDVGLWLFSDCGTNPVCLDYVNDYQAGIPEKLSFSNESDEQVTVYLGVDCWRSPSESATGAFTIKINSDLVVETEKKSFGSIRALYR